MSKYRSPEAFKQALNSRIKKRAKERGMLFNRCLQLFLFDRFMARVYEARPDDVILKGGFVMELRIQTPRTTRDVDIRITGKLDIEPVKHTIYPKETHVAEKLHALTYEWPDDRVNSRVKDLVDLGLFATRCEFRAEPLLRSIEATFAFRATHEVPETMPPPPAGWGFLYASMAREHNLEWNSIDRLQDEVEAFLNPLLAGDADFEEWAPDDGWS